VTDITVPSIAEIEADMRSKVKPGKELFYSLKTNGENEAKAYARKHGLHTIWDYLDKEILEKGNIGQSQEYFESASIAYAKVVTGKTYVLLDGDPSKNSKSWAAGTIWDTVEWPELEKRSDVQVYRISPSMDPSHGVQIH
jgi:hypothetical protein